MDRVEKNDIVVVDILDMNQDGEGVGKVNGYPLFIKDTVIGDKAEHRQHRQPLSTTPPPPTRTHT